MLTVKGTARRKTEPSGTYLNANQRESERFKPTSRSGWVDEHHRIAKVDDAHQ
jgi:hypothetical protein